MKKKYIEIYYEFICHSEGKPFMIFNSFTFIIFFLLFLFGWKFLKNYSLPRILYLVVSSAIFYGWWDWRFLFLIFYTGSIDFLLALLMGNCKQNSWQRKTILAASIINAVGILSIFKYSVFFAEILNDFFRIFGFETHLENHIPEFCLILPVGISFFTFQSMSYTIDVYRNELKPTRSYFLYMSYLMLFPQLVAGPIVRAKDLLYSLTRKPLCSETMRYNGLKLVIIGFFKKCFLADNVAQLVNPYFDNVPFWENGFAWWIVIILFGIQIYCDFSGYSDIARGIIKLMGYRFNLNFNHPYIACSIKEFWGRWHISLSSWFRDYVYIPLGGSRSGRHPRLNAIRNVWISFLLSGLWHGAAWNFITWGALHAGYLTLERTTNYQEHFRKKWYGVLFCFLFVQLQVLMAWVFFRAQTMDDALCILSRMFTLSAGEFDLRNVFLLYLIVFAGMELFMLYNLDRLLAKYLPLDRKKVEPVLLAVLAFITIFFRGDGNAFIYFQF